MKKVIKYMIPKSLKKYKFFSKSSGGGNSGGGKSPTDYNCDCRFGSNGCGKLGSFGH